MDDGLVERSYLELSLQAIERVVDGLREQLRRVKSISVGVEELRRGFVGAAALFDSPTAVRQGDNIRQLTYLTMLFLPLTFCTSIFGIQVVLPTPLPLKMFIIAMPTIFVGTMFIMVNAHNFVTLIESLKHSVTVRVRQWMQRSDIQSWQDAEESLQVDQDARKLSTKMVARRTTQWWYAWFLLQVLFVKLPVKQVNQMLLSPRTTATSSQARPPLARVASWDREEPEESKNAHRCMSNFHLGPVYRVLAAACLPLSMLLVFLELLALGIYLQIFGFRTSPDSTNTKKSTVDVALERLNLGNQAQEDLPPGSNRGAMRHESGSQSRSRPLALRHYVIQSSSISPTARLPKAAREERARKVSFQW